MIKKTVSLPWQSHNNNPLWQWLKTTVQSGVGIQSSVFRANQSRSIFFKDQRERFNPGQYYLKIEKLERLKIERLNSQQYSTVSPRWWASSISRLWTPWTEKSLPAPASAPTPWQPPWGPPSPSPVTLAWSPMGQPAILPTVIGAHRRVPAYTARMAGGLLGGLAQSLVKVHGRSKKKYI